MPLSPRGPKDAVTYWRLAHRLYLIAKSIVREVVRMGNGRGAKVLRFVVCVVITILVMLLTAPKAC